MSKLRKKFIAILAVLILALLASSTALFIPKTNTANATTSSGNWTDIGEIYSGNGGFNAKNMQLLYKALTGNKDATYETVKTTLNGAAAKNGYHYLTSENVRKFNDGNNVSVTFGGIKWNVTYVTTTRSDVDTDNDGQGDIIVDLWQAKENLTTSAYNVFEKAITGADGVALVNQTYPSNMYSTSYMRTVTLNAGGYYATSVSTLMGEQALTPQTGNFYHRFTVTAEQGESDSLIPYLVQPKYVAYQETENTHDNHHLFGIWPKSTCPNDAYGTPEGGIKTTPGSTGTATPLDYSGKGTNDGKPETNYDAWKNDYLWLVSVSETGNYDDETVNGNGIWQTDVSLRSAPGSQYVWVRTATPGNTVQVDVNCDDGFTNHFNTTATTNLVRPAIHFNLTAAKTLYTKDIETTYTGSDITLSSIYTTKSSEAPWYIPDVYSDDVDCEYKLNGNVSQVLNVGTYTATMKFNNNTAVSDLGFKWDAKSLSSTVNIVVKEKPVKVKFTKGVAGSVISDGYSVTSGDTSNYPAVDWFDTDQIASTDTGDRRPELKIKYFSKKESKYLSDGEVPIKPGDYTLYVELKYEATAQHKNYKLDSTSKTSIDFTIKPIEVKAPSLSGESGLTYDGNEHTITIADHSSDIKYTVYKDNEQIASLVDVTAQTFNVKDAGVYTVTFAFDDEKKETRVWKDTDSNEPFDADDFTVKKAELTLTVSGDTEFGKGSWGKGIKKEFTISVSGAVSGEDVQLNVYFTKKDGSDRKSLTEADGKYTISDSLDKGDYILYCELTDAPDGTVNDYKKENYVIKYEDKKRFEKSFTIGNSDSQFKESDLEWIYTNAGVDEGDEKEITSGTHLTYNGYIFNISLKSGFNELAAMGVKMDGSIQGATSRKNANGVEGAETEYIIKVKLVALNEDYNFEDTEVEFKWYIDKANYDLTSYTPEWSYTARGNTKVYPESGVQYEGGTAAGDNGYIEISISAGLPDDLVPIFDVGYRQSEVGEHTLHITGFTNNDPNYNSISTIPAGVSWITFNWKIVKRNISTAAQFWGDAEYSDGEVTKGPELKTSPYNPKLIYEYYETSDCSGSALTLADLTYEEGVAKTYYVKVSLDSSETGNWILSSDSNPHGFVVGVTKTAVEITISGGGEYDGTSKEIKIAIVGEVEGIDLDAFEITYYGEDGEILTGAPSDAGTYSVAVALKKEFADSYYIKSDKTYDLVITTRVLELPKYDGTLTYDGNEQDIAKLAGLPDGWENYIEITINGNAGSKIKDVGNYNVIFKIKEGVKAGNVAWNTTSNKTSPRTLQVTMNQLVLHAKKWSKNGYYTALEFEEEDGDKFVTYTVRNANGDIVTEAEFYANPDDEYEIEVSVAEEHGANVKIEYAGGVNPKLKFIGSSTDEGDAAELENSKQAAKEELEKEAKAKQDAIDADNNLTAEEKAAAKAEIEKELEDGKAEIDKATDKGGVNKALDEAKKEIDDTAELVQKKGAAKAELQKDADKKNAEIDASDMTDEEKAAAKAEVEAELQRGFDNIDKAASESEINSSYTESKTIIDEVKIIRKNTSSFPWWIIAVVAGALVVAAVVIVVLKKRKATAEGEEDYYDDEYYGDEDEEYDYEDEEFIDDGDDY